MLTAVGVLIVLVASWFLLISPRRATATDLRQQATTEQQNADALRDKLADLKAKAKQLPAQEELLRQIQARVPDNPQLPALIRALTAAAADADVELVAITPVAPTTVIAPGGAAGSKGTSSSAATPTSAVGSAATPAPGLPAITLQSLPLTLVVQGRYMATVQFVSNLENLTRAFLVTGVQISAGATASGGGAAPALGSTTSTPVVSVTVTGSVFLAPSAPSAGASATPPPSVPAPSAAPAS